MVKKHRFSTILNDDRRHRHNRLLCCLIVKMVEKTCSFTCHQHYYHHKKKNHTERNNTKKEREKSRIFFGLLFYLRIGFFSLGFSFFLAGLVWLKKDRQKFQNILYLSKKRVCGWAVEKE